MQEINCLQREAQKEESRQKKKTVQRDRSPGPDSVMKHLLELSDGEFKIPMINVLKD